MVGAVTGAAVGAAKGWTATACSAAASGRSVWCRHDRFDGSQRLALQHAGLLLDQAEEGACGRFLSGQKLLVQARGLLLQVLQGLQALPGHLQCILQ